MCVCVYACVCVCVWTHARQKLEKQMLEYGVNKTIYQKCAGDVTQASRNGQMCFRKVDINSADLLGCLSGLLRMTCFIEPTVEAWTSPKHTNIMSTANLLSRWNHCINPCWRAACVRTQWTEQLWLCLNTEQARYSRRCLVANSGRWKEKKTSKTRIGLRGFSVRNFWHSTTSWFRTGNAILCIFLRSFSTGVTVEVHGLDSSRILSTLNMKKDPIC